MSMQPNVADKIIISSPKLWMLIVLVGTGAGIGGAALMKLLRFVQFIVWPHVSGDFLDVVKQAAPLQRILVLGAAGVMTVMGLAVLRLIKSNEKY